MAKSADGQQSNRNKSSSVQRGRGSKQQLDEELLQKRWHIANRNKCAPTASAPIGATRKHVEAADSHLRDLGSCNRAVGRL
eukprot:4138768-Amphidinium_carterae.1